MVRWISVFLATLLAFTLGPPMSNPAQAEPGDTPTVTAGRAPQQRGLPATATTEDAVAPNNRPPVVPPVVRAGGDPEKVSRQQLTRARQAAPGEAFKDLLLRPGYVVGDTSLVVLFNLADEAFTSWRVDLFDVSTGTKQESVTLGKDALATSICRQPRKYCKSLGTAEGWTLDAGKDYFVTITAIYPDGDVPSAASEQSRPRATVDPPAIPNRQAAGCGCSGALGMTDASQAIRAIGVNTGTGAFTRSERDLALSSYGVSFTSSRAYSSLNTGPSAFGPGWAWIYDMKVTESEGGAVVRAEDGSDVLFASDGDAYSSPPGVRSTLRRAGTGWELVTRNNIVFGFDAQGRLASILNPRQAGLRLTYAADSIKVKDQSGHEVQVKVQDGLIRWMLLPDLRKVSYDYTDGLLTKVRDARGEYWKYRYDAAGRLTQVIDPYLKTTQTNEYDPATGRMVKQTDALGAATTFGWNAGKQEATTTDADNVVVWDGYKGNVLLYSQRGNGDTNNHRYDGRLNRNLVVNGNQNQHESQYDAAGNLIEQFAPQKRFSSKIQYDARNNPTTHVDAEGETWKDEYNEFDELIRSTDPENHSVTYEYDTRGLPVRVTDQRGKITTIESIADGRPNAGLRFATVTPEGRRIETGYDKTGRAVSYTDPRGFVPGARKSDYTTLTYYDDQDRTVATLEPGKRNAARSEFDAVGRLRKSITPEGVTTTYAYLDNSAIKAAFEERRTLLYTYTPAGRRATMAIDMQHSPDLVNSWAYNAKGLVESVTSPRGNLPGANKADFTTTYVYDANDNPVQISRPYPGGIVVKRDIAVDDLDRTVETTDEFGAKAKFDRNNSGDVRGSTDSLGRKTGMTYDKNGRQTGISDPKGGETKTEYDAAGNKIKTISPTGGITTYEYTDDGLLSALTEPRGNVAGADKERYTAHFEYDRAGNQVRAIDALDNVTTTKYDANNRTVSTTDALNHTTYFDFDEDNRTSKVIGPDANALGATTYEYGEDGAIAAVRDPKGRTTRVDYDEAGRMVRTTDPLGRSTYASYDADSNRTETLALDRLEVPWLLSDRERAKRTVVDEYDIVGRRTKRSLGTGGPVYTWGYDAKDRTTSAGDPTGVRDYTYDDEDQIKTVTRKEADRPDEVFTYGYDERGNVTSRQYPNGTAVGFGYDAASRITSLSTAAANWSFGYDVAGRRTSTTLPGATGLTENRSYDDAGRLTAIGTERTGDPVAGVQDPVSRYDLTLDAVGNPTRVITTRGGTAESVAYEYDKADRVTAACYATDSCDSRARPAGRIDYDYDLVGNRTSQKRSGTAGSDLTTYNYDAADQLQSELLLDGAHSRLTTYDYDERGNQTKAGGDRLTYHLDNSVASANVNGRTTAFDYDAAGLRQSSTTTAPGQGATKQRWTWDVAGTLPQIAQDSTADAAGTVTESRSFTYGPDDEPLGLLDASGAAHSYTHDWLGGVANMLSPTGTLEKGYDYDPFGNPRVGATLAAQEIPSEGTGVENPMQFHGAYQDSTTGSGNYFMRARNYDPGTGRFATRDPMPTAAGSTSAYTYADNNPMAMSDPTGMMPDAGPTTTTEGTTETTGPSPEDLAKAKQLQSKSTLDVILEAGGQILMEILGINDILNCLKGDLMACVSMIVGALPWGKIFKAKKIAEAIFKAGKAVLTFFQELKWAKAIISGAEKAAEAAKAAAAAAAKAAAEKAAKAKAAAEAAAKKVAAEAAEKAKALAAKAKAKTKKSAGDSGGDGPSCPINAGKHSFVAGTPVLLADGTEKPIEKVEPGDTVKATDPETGASGDRQVTHTIRTDDDKEFIDLGVTGADGEQHTITTTESHPFWSVTRKEWVDAGKLKEGELLKTAAGTYVQVSKVKAYADDERTYDLTVDGLHTYYVAAGDTSLLVHNCGGAGVTNGRPHSTSCTCASGGPERIPNNPWGGKGKPSTQAQNEDLQQQFMDANPDWKHQAGGTKPEQNVDGPNGEVRRPDLIFEHPSGQRIYIQTVTTYKNGAAIPEELEAALDIAKWGNGLVIMYPKVL